ncbi:MAG: carbohydrate ABC transporter permease [Clostridia bacterium]|nr:carbohydrate ABC transporter permease [Clostridia bacterium]
MAKTQIKKLRAAGTVAVLSVIVVVLFFPLFVMLVRSIMTEAEIFDYPKLLPSGFHFQSYHNARYSADFLKWTGNTVTVVVCNIVGTVLSGFLCAYGFAKVHFKFKGLWFALTMASTMLPSITLRIPLYMMFHDWGWLGTLNPLIVPAFFGGGALNIFLIMQFIKGIPDSIFESAKIDGANNLRCMYSIALPNCVPLVAYLCITTFLGVWNDYSSALIYLTNSREKWTLALGLYKTALDPLFRDNQKMAMGVLMCIPPLVVFGFSQKQLIEGVSMTGIKA